MAWKLFTGRTMLQYSEDGCQEIAFLMWLQPYNSPNSLSNACRMSKSWPPIWILFCRKWTVCINNFWHEGNVSKIDKYMCNLKETLLRWLELYTSYGFLPNTLRLSKHYYETDHLLQKRDSMCLNKGTTKMSRKEFCPGSPIIRWCELCKWYN